MCTKESKVKVLGNCRNRGNGLIVRYFGNLLKTLLISVGSFLLIVGINSHLRYILFVLRDKLNSLLMA